MRILYICGDMGVEIGGRKGAATHVREACHALQRYGHEVLLVTPSPGDKSQVRVPMIEVPAPTSRLLGMDLRYVLLNSRMRRMLRRVHRQFRPEAVYERYSIYQSAGSEYCRRHNLPRILEVNTLLAHEMGTRLHWPKLAHRFECSLWRREKAIICVSQMLKQLMIESAGIDESRMCGFVISPVAVDPEVFHPGIEPSTDPAFGIPGKKIAGYMGTLTSWHGVDLFFDAARMLRDGGHQLAIVAVGGETERVNRLRARVREEGLQDHLQFFGSVPHSEVPAYLAKMDVCVIADTQDWSSPTKFFEFAAMERPVVAARSPAVEEVFGPRADTGLMFERGNAQSMVEQILRLTGDPELAHSLGCSARLRVLVHYTWERNVRTIVDLFQAQATAGARAAAQ